VSTGRRVKTFEQPISTFGLAFSWDGARIAVVSAASGRGVALFDLATEKVLWTRRCRDDQIARYIDNPAFSADGKYLLPGVYSEGVIPFLDATTGEESFTLRVTNEDFLREMVFSPDGKTLATCASGDRDVRLWDYEQKQLIRTLKGCSWPLAFSSDGKLLATRGDRLAAIVWPLVEDHDVAPLSPDERGFGVPGKEWAELAGADAFRAHQTMRTLVADPGRAVSVLRERLMPAPDLSRRFPQLLAELDSDEFEVRERASAELEKADRGVEAPLRRALEGALSGEQRRRVTALVERLDEQAVGPLSIEEVRKVRAVWVLEQIGTPGARQLLETLATGVAEARQTQDARTSLQRLSRRPATRP
jgi:hypothetical protein